MKPSELRDRIAAITARLIGVSNDLELVKLDLNQERADALASPPAPAAVEGKELDWPDAEGVWKQHHTLYVAMKGPRTIFQVRSLYGDSFMFKDDQRARRGNWLLCTVTPAAEGAEWNELRDFLIENEHISRMAKVENAPAAFRFAREKMDRLKPPAPEPEAKREERPARPPMLRAAPTKWCSSGWWARAGYSWRSVLGSGERDSIELYAPSVDRTASDPEALRIYDAEVTSGGEE